MIAIHSSATAARLAARGTHLYVSERDEEAAVMLTTKRPRKPVQIAYLDELLDQALEQTFPASDPIAIAVEHGSFEPEQVPGDELRAAPTRPRGKLRG